MKDEAVVGAAAKPAGRLGRGSAGPARIALMAKAPVAGFAKTRLSAVLGHDGAAALAERMLLHAARAATAAATRAGSGPVTLWVTPDDRHAAFQHLQRTEGVVLRCQPEGDLGARMAHVFTSAFAAGPAPVLLMGTDAPALTADSVGAAAALLCGHDAVFVPAIDGGYVLVGLDAAPPDRLDVLFSGIAWSTPHVMSQTRARLAAAGLRHAEGAAVHDIDEPADLAHLPPSWTAAVTACMDRAATLRTTGSPQR